MFWSFTYSQGVGESFVFDHSFKIKHGIVFHGFLLDGKILYLEPKQIFRVQNGKELASARLDQWLRG